MDEPDTPGALKARALRYLVRREHSRAELARKLAPHAESREALEGLLDELVSRKQLSDERYVRNVRSGGASCRGGDSRWT